MNAGTLPDARELLNEFGREYLTQRTSQCLPAWQGIHHFHLGIPGFDAISEIHRENAHVDGFHDVFVEVFEALVLRDLLLKRCVKAAILNGDGKISGDSFEQFHVFAG